MEMMLPNEKRMANLTGLPVATLNSDPNDRSCMIYPRYIKCVPTTRHMPNPISL